MSAVDTFNQTIIDEFRANEGRVGGMLAGIPIVLLTTTGAKSGQRRLNPLAALVEGETVYVFASAAGAAKHPAWYHNLVAHPQVEVEIGTDHYTATATTLTGATRDEIYERQKAVIANFAEYEEKTKGIRTIPVVALTRAGT